MISRTRILIWVFVALLGCASCSRRSSQRTAEGQTFLWVQEWVELYELLNPGITITNMEQVYRGLKRAYPHLAEDEFRRYGKYAGFKRSFFEKYVFFPPGTTSYWAGGEVVFMNAQPFPLSNQKEMGRYVALKNANVGRRSLNEEIVQKMLTEEGIKPLPLGTISPPPGRPLEPEVAFHLKVNDKFFRVCSKLGLELETTIMLWRIAVWLPVFLVLLGGVWFWRSRRRVEDRGSR